MKSKLPLYLQRFFWEYAPDSLDIHQHASVIMARIMERGSWQAMIWLNNTYPPEVIRDFLFDKGWQVLAPREVNYWALISGMPEEAKKRLVRKAADRDAIWSQRSAC
jgi:hypothetical protein